MQMINIKHGLGIFYAYTDIPTTNVKSYVTSMSTLLFLVGNTMSSRLYYTVEITVFKQHKAGIKEYLERIFFIDLCVN